MAWFVHYFSEIAVITTNMLLFLWLLLHPFHVSVCEVTYDEASRAVQITHRIFLDDLEQGLRRMTGDDHLDITVLSDGNRKSLEAYFRKNFEVRLDGQVTKYAYLGHEIENDVMWCYVEITSVTSLPKISLKDQILTEIYEDQKNIVHFKIGEDKKSFILDKEEITATYQK